MTNEFVVITGPNGGGKSTLAKLIAGILLIRPGAGSCLTARISQVKALPREPTWESASRFSRPVRFKGVQVLDLIRLAAKKTCLRRMPAAICRRLAYVQKDYINREVNAKSFRRRAETNRKSPRFWPGRPGCRYLMSRRRGLISGASRT